MILDQTKSLFVKQLRDENENLNINNLNINEKSTNDDTNNDDTNNDELTNSNVKELVKDKIEEQIIDKSKNSKKGKK